MSVGAEFPPYGGLAPIARRHRRLGRVAVLSRSYGIAYRCAKKVSWRFMICSGVRSSTCWASHHL